MNLDDVIAILAAGFIAICFLSILFMLVLMFGGCAPSLHIPPDTYITETPCPNSSAFGCYNPDTKEIRIDTPIPFTSRLVLAHELGHVWGIESCPHPYCLMYEGEGVYKYLAMPIQALYGFRFCPRCKDVLKAKGALK